VYGGQPRIDLVVRIALSDELVGKVVELPCRHGLYLGSLRSSGANTATVRRGVVVVTGTKGTRRAVCGFRPGGRDQGHDHVEDAHHVPLCQDSDGEFTTQPIPSFLRGRRTNPSLVRRTLFARPVDDVPTRDVGCERGTPP
jgi:hypothetical protein